MLLFAARTRYSLVKGERIVRFVLTAQLRAFSMAPWAPLYGFPRRAAQLDQRGGTNSIWPRARRPTRSTLPVAAPAKPSWARPVRVQQISPGYYGPGQQRMIVPCGYYYSHVFWFFRPLDWMSKKIGSTDLSCSTGLCYLLELIVPSLIGKKSHV